jgi:2-polyprenyl-6-methoxyphenol hydroxylase-like FAD-dependent oxidoreductase
MHRRGLRVRIIGAGTGGLCLAQGLKRDEVEVELFERDRTPTDRQQGYRLSINATGRRALRTCLPAELFGKLVASSAKPSENVTFLDHHLNRLLVVDLPRRDRQDAESELPVSRIALRSILSEGLDGAIHYDKKCAGFDIGPEGSVTARFEDGSSTTGDVLIGADGASSFVRGQLLPHAQRVETGIVAVSGKLRLDNSVRQAAPQPILRGPTLILGSRGCFMFANAVDYDTEGSEQCYEREKYVMWGFSAHNETLDLPADSAALSGWDAMAPVIKLMDRWHPALQRLVQTTDPSTVTAFVVKTSTPIQPWPTRNVTLLGDALHNMTPFRGIGANTALRDAAALHQTLVAVTREQAELINALTAYERDMIEYGFTAVQASLNDMKRFHAKGLLTRTAVKFMLRAIDYMPPLKDAFLHR